MQIIMWSCGVENDPVPTTLQTGDKILFQDQPFIVLFRLSGKMFNHSLGVRGSDGTAQRFIAPDTLDTILEEAGLTFIFDHESLRSCDASCTTEIHTIIPISPNMRVDF